MTDFQIRLVGFLASLFLVSGTVSFSLAAVVLGRFVYMEFFER